jgi:hypothetical protein
VKKSDLAIAIGIMIAATMLGSAQTQTPQVSPKQQCSLASLRQRGSAEHGTQRPCL